ncbi:MAG: L,D-transpeptidase [Chloroflexi bacterium]|nr:L,D-transpeptidase [Chloroflexota bacterium]MBV9895483.1 L,D-transpeptidase [Chloroflexota bacterium]
MKAVILSGFAAAVVQLAAYAPVEAAPNQWNGSVSGAGAGVYAAPGGAQISSLDAGSQVVVSNWVYGPALTSDNYTWADLGDGRFVHSAALRHAPLPESPPAPPQIVSSGHWADANLTQQILTLYDGAVAVHMSLMNSGRPGPDTETHLGIWPIKRRVADETMRGDGYDIAGVLFTQYFTDDAEAIHLNYWLSDDERGMPRSHGCLGLPYADAALAWRFLDVGSLVYVHP